MIKIEGKHFININNNEKIIFRGTNIALKGPPWLPDIGEGKCNDNEIIGCSLDNSFADKFDEDNTIKDKQNKCYNSDINECGRDDGCVKIKKGLGSYFCEKGYDNLCGETCKVFNQTLINELIKKEYNSIRLSVSWEGAQPDKHEGLDPEFKRRLINILKLCKDNNIYVLLNNHGDMVSTLNCGFGIPVWLSLKVPEIQEILSNNNNSLLSSELSIEINNFLKNNLFLVNKILGKNYSKNDIDEGKLSRMFAKDLSLIECNDWNDGKGKKGYNLNNKCCQKINRRSNQPRLSMTAIAQLTLNYIFNNNEGQEYFINYWKEIVKLTIDYDNVFAIDPLNEPMTFERSNYYKTIVKLTKEITKINKNICVGISDFANGAFIPHIINRLVTPTNILFSIISYILLLLVLLIVCRYKKIQNTIYNFILDLDTVKYIQNSNNIYYSFHHYGNPSINDCIDNVNSMCYLLNIPSMMTESTWKSEFPIFWNNEISTFHWTYASYCNTGSSFKENNFGACILGWGSSPIPDSLESHKKV